MSTTWGQHAVRLAIAIGRDADHSVLQQFIGNPEIRPLSANSPEQLTHFLRWASVAAVEGASVPPEDSARGGIYIPEPPREPDDLTW